MKKEFAATISLLVVVTTLFAQTPDQLLLKNYRPKSIYKIPVTKVEQARYPVIDIHSHVYAKTDKEINDWIATKNRVGVERTIILTKATGKEFDDIVNMYSKHKDRFLVWCGIDFTGYDQPGWSQKAVRELERCVKMGATGVGELSDKGMGLTAASDGSKGIHIDDPRLKPVFQKCAELRLPINIHVAEPYWMYEKMDSTNDGLMNAYTWKVDLTKKGIYDHEKLVQTLENAVRDNPQTTFIACHFANCCYNLDKVGALLDKYPNLYFDVSARYGETAPIPRFMTKFYNKYSDRLLYGTDMGRAESMYHTTFRILETADEHFYATDQLHYHSACHGFDLPDEVLKKLYRDNALKILKKEP